MRKLIGTIVLLIFLVIGFTGVNLKVNSTEIRIKPFIKNLLVEETSNDDIKGERLNFNND